MKQTKHAKIFEDRGRIYTINLVKGKKVYGERLFIERGIEYREWDIRRSKLGAAIKKKDDTHKMAESNKAFAHYRW